MILYFRCFVSIFHVVISKIVFFLVPTRKLPRVTCTYCTCTIVHLWEYSRSHTVWERVAGRPFSALSFRMKYASSSSCCAVRSFVKKDIFPSGEKKKFFARASQLWFSRKKKLGCSKSKRAGREGNPVPFERRAQKLRESTEASFFTLRSEGRKVLSPPLTFSFTWL